MAIGISLLKNSTNIKPDFCKTYTLDKQHKMHIKESLINTIDELRICLHVDLFGGKNTLLGVGNYQYRAIFIDKAIHIRFPIIIKSKDTIYDKSKIFFNKIEIYTGSKMQYF